MHFGKSHNNETLHVGTLNTNVFFLFVFCYKWNKFMIANPNLKNGLVKYYTNIKVKYNSLIKIIMGLEKMK
jgi:hypothetical protein